MKGRSPTFLFWKLSPLIASIAAVALLIAGVLVVLYGKQSYEAQKVNEAGVQARILASTVSAALYFNDREAAQAYVNALSVNPEVKAALLYNASGSLFVGYWRGNGEAPHAMTRSGGPHIEGDTLTITMPVIEEALPIGTVLLETSIGSLARRLSPYFVLALLATMTSLVIAVLGFAQKALTKANSELANRAFDLVAANDSLQVQINEREKAEQALRQAQKMEAIGQLTGGVAHDFNNLLTVVIGTLHLIQGKPADANAISRLASTALQATERGARLIERLLMFARRQPMHPETINPNRLVTEFETLIRRVTGANVHLTTQLSATLGSTRIDRTQFETATLNLIVNAKEAISGDGRILIETRDVELGPDDLPDNPDLVPGSYVLVAVSDNGRGIPPDKQARVFDPFFTTKEFGQGSGLGLSQVYGFVKESGGYVSIRSEVGVGTTVSLYLPRSTEPEVAVEPAPRSIRQLQEAESATVLVVEDEPLVLGMAVEILNEFGYHVLAAENAVEALEILRGEERIDVLFSDVVMPGEINGAQLAVAAARVRPALKVLLTSGYTASALAEEHGLNEKVPLLQKPYRAQDLAAHLRVIMNAA